MSILQTFEFLEERIQSDRRTFWGHENERDNIKQLIHRTAVYSESNSALLIGPRGIGKSTLLTNVFYDLILSDTNFLTNTMIVYLNGMLDTDDRIALRAITEQLNLDENVSGKIFGSFAEHLAYLLNCLKSGNKNQSKSIIFLLDEFDQFCGHHNQTLLYNLFDVAQSAQAPICVIGITVRLDVVELLEKRVKSRFSHRQIFLHPEQISFEMQTEIFVKLLSLPTEQDIQKSFDETSELDDRDIKNKELVFLLKPFRMYGYKFPDEWSIKWNDRIKEIIKIDKVKLSLQQIYNYRSTIATLKSIIYQIIKSMDINTGRIDVTVLSDICSKVYRDDKIFLLLSVSVLQLALIIAMKHHSEIYDNDPFNFEIIFTRYQKFEQTLSVTVRTEKSVALTAYEELSRIRLIIPLNTNAVKEQIQYQMHRMLLTKSQIMQGISKYTNLPTELNQWAQSSVV